MKPISHSWFCQIDVTNFCGINCLYCSRNSKHIRPDQRRHMDLDTFQNALKSLKGWPNRVGIIGGEPLLHPQFEELCTLLAKHFPRERAGLWTSGGPRFQQFKPLIDRTFALLAYNEHNPVQVALCKHQPLTMSVSDMVPEPVLRKRLIDDCWVQRNWCPTIGPKGAFFCEVAYGWDTILDGPGGYPIEPGWWLRTPGEFQDQVERYCTHCGMCLPYERELIQKKREKFTPTTLRLCREHNLPHVTDDEIELITEPLTVDQIRQYAQSWYPGNYRGDRQPNDTTACEGKGSTISI